MSRCLSHSTGEIKVPSDRWRTKELLEPAGPSRPLETSKVSIKERLERWSCSPQNSWLTVMELLTPPTNMLTVVFLEVGHILPSNTSSRLEVSTQKLSTLTASEEEASRNLVSPAWLKDSLKNYVVLLSLGVTPLNGLAVKKEVSTPSEFLIGPQSRRMKLKSLSNWLQ